MGKNSIIKNGKLQAEINSENGQLISLTSNGIEYFHNGGSSSFDGPGWGNSEVVPFPIFGPAAKQKVRVGQKLFSLEQHGISRHTNENPSLPNQVNDNIISLVQRYSGRDIDNPKYSPGNGHPEYLNWLPYTLEKTFELSNEGLICSLKVTNDSDIEMPYMLGWHPAFKVHGRVEDGEFLNDDGVCIASLEEVIIQSEIPPEEALTIKGTQSVTYKNKITKLGVKVSSDDFSDNIMLWSPGFNSGMLCIEHTSQLPVYEGQDYFGEPDRFELLGPGERKAYSIMVLPLEG